jgi:FAD-dependent oxidoreductase domain-containing protein 1
VADLSCDVAIVGGGGMGAATAYFLSQMGGGHLKVAVFEPDPTYARAATALAAGGIRQQFSTPENILMSQFGYRFFESLGETLSVEGERPDIGLTPRPYLRLVAEAGREALRAHCELQQSLGAGSTWLEPGELAARFPWMDVSGVAAAILGGAGEGLFDPYSMLQAFRRKGQSLGAAYHAQAVAGMEMAADGRSVAALRLADGARVACGMAVNAAGPRAAGVAAMAGLALPVAAYKAQSYAFRAEHPIPDCPVVLDQAGGVQFKPEGPLFVCAAPDRGQPQPVGADDFDIDLDAFEAVVWPRLAARAPQFASLKLVRGWTGHIEVNTLDANPIIGLHPDRPNLYFLNGFSGHGAQHVPAAGRAMAELILYGEYRTLDLRRFGYERLLRGEPLPETA